MRSATKRGSGSIDAAPLPDQFGYVSSFRAMVLSASTRTVALVTLAALDGGLRLRAAVSSQRPADVIWVLELTALAAADEALIGAGIDRLSLRRRPPCGRCSRCLLLRHVHPVRPVATLTPIEAGFQPHKGCRTATVSSGLPSTHVEASPLAVTTRWHDLGARRVVTVILCPACDRETPPLSQLSEASLVFYFRCDACRHIWTVDKDGSGHINHVTPLLPRAPKTAKQSLFTSGRMGCLMPHRVCPTCGKPGRLLPDSSADSIVEYWRCDTCGAVWSHRKDDPNAPAKSVTRASDGAKWKEG